MRLATVITDKINLQIGLKVQKVLSPDAFQKGHCLAIATHKEVLSIIDGVAGLGVLKRIGASSQDLASFQNCHFKTFFGQGGGSGQSGEAASDHNYSPSRTHRHSHQARSASHNLTGVGTRIRVATP